MMIKSLILKRGGEVPRLNIFIAGFHLSFKEQMIPKLLKLRCMIRIHCLNYIDLRFSQCTSLVSIIMVIWAYVRNTDYVALPQTHRIRSSGVGFQEFKALGRVKCMLKFENHCCRYSWHTVNIQKAVYVASSSGIIPKYICFFPFFSQYHNLSS